MTVGPIGTIFGMVVGHDLTPMIFPISRSKVCNVPFLGHFWLQEIGLGAFNGCTEDLFFVRI